MARLFHTAIPIYIKVSNMGWVFLDISVSCSPVAPHGLRTPPCMSFWGAGASGAALCWVLVFFIASKRGTHRKLSEESF